MVMVEEAFSKFSLARSPDYIPLLPGQRLVIIGDIHGNFDLLVDRLQVGGVLDDDHHWKRGESSIVVQVGDILDRGSRELECLELLCRLSHEAVLNGGAVVVLWGNHELMNVSGDFRCVLSNDPWKREFEPFIGQEWSAEWKRRYFTPSLVHNLPTFPARWAACQPGGILSKLFFVHCKVAVQVGHTVCVHAHWDGLCFDEYKSIAEANERVANWILDFPSSDQLSGDERFLTIDESMDAVLPVSVPFWGSSRHPNQEEIGTTLSRFNNDVNRLVVGHERVTHIQSLANGRLWKVDCQGQPEVLEVTHLDTVMVLRRQTEKESLEPCSQLRCGLWETFWSRLTRILFELSHNVASTFHTWIKA